MIILYIIFVIRVPIIRPRHPLSVPLHLLPGGHWHIPSRLSLSEVWRPHAWVAEWNRQFRPNWGPLDF